MEHEDVTPRCMVCDEPVDLEKWMDKLDANQPFIDWLNTEVHLPESSSGWAPMPPMCEACKHNPERVDQMLTPERAQRIIQEQVNRASRFRELDS